MDLGIPKTIDNRISSNAQNTWSVMQRTVLFGNIIQMHEVDAFEI